YREQIVSAADASLRSLKELSDAMRRYTAGDIGPREFKAISELAVADETKYRQLTAREGEIEEKKTNLKTFLVARAGASPLRRASISPHHLHKFAVCDFHSAG